ncbi:MAG: septum formation inhibitor Maf [Epsilonproteobacteria bacterium]|nr:septum formation inhibitor Maf [Campylobacterota bacterium]
MSEIILASKSPTRAKILKNYNVSFKQVDVDFDEDALKISIPKIFVYRATKGKLESYLRSNSLETPVLCADTVVCANNEILRKAKDENDARQILEKQSGNSVWILTCMMYKSKKLEFIDLSVTKYLFMPFETNKIEEYLLSDEWRGKAGACMVEGFCRQYIRQVIGLQSTAMGLSVEKLMPILKLNNAIL